MELKDGITYLTADELVKTCMENPPFPLCLDGRNIQEWELKEEDNNLGLFHSHFDVSEDGYPMYLSVVAIKRKFNPIHNGNVEDTEKAETYSCIICDKEPDEAIATYVEIRQAMK